MKSRFAGTFFQSALLSAGMLIAALAPVASMAGNVSRQQQLSICRLAAGGSFLTTIFNPDGSVASRGLITLTKAGDFFVGDSNQAGIDGVFNAFTTGQGAWRCADKYTLSATAINFTLPGVASNSGSIARVDYTATFKSKNVVTGTAELRFFNLNDDPLNTNIPPASVLTFTGQRITAK